jgi:hypothetical protein
MVFAGDAAEARDQGRRIEIKTDRTQAQKTIEAKTDASKGRFG